MSATLIDGKALAQKLRTSVKQEAEQLKAAGLTPGLAVIIVGEDPASQTYVRSKIKACEEAGFYSKALKLPEQTTQAELLAHIVELNQDQTIHGILVQLPLPKHISEKAVIDAISPEKDVDGFHPLHAGNLLIGDRGFLPCTPYGVLKMIQETGTEISGKHVVVVGRSNIVGKPVALLMLRENATVSIAHSKTSNLAELTKQADILIVAVGKAKMIGAEHVKPGAIVIDVGMNRDEQGKLCGDVDFETVKEVAGFITPVPGGVGPMTITMLLVNTLEAAREYGQK